MSYFVLWFFKLTAAPLAFLYLKTKAMYSGKKPDTKGKTLIVSNHISMLDPIIIGCLYFFRTIRVIASSHLFRMSGIFGWFLTKIGTLGTGREGDDMGAISGAVRLLEEQKCVCIFPEGKLSKEKVLLPFYAGAAAIILKADPPIIPVYLYGERGFFKRAKVVVGSRFRIGEYLAPDIEAENLLDAVNAVLKAKILELQELVPLPKTVR